MNFRLLPTTEIEINTAELAKEMPKIARFIIDDVRDSQLSEVFIRVYTAVLGIEWLKAHHPEVANKTLEYLRSVSTECLHDPLYLKALESTNSDLKKLVMQMYQIMSVKIGYLMKNHSEIYNQMMNYALPKIESEIEGVFMSMNPHHNN